MELLATEDNYKGMHAGIIIIILSWRYKWYSGDLVIANSILSNCCKSHNYNNNYYIKESFFMTLIHIKYTHSNAVDDDS